MLTRDDGLALVIPARDEARLLPSVLAAVPEGVQRVIVVDDASRDDTAGVVRGWGDSRGLVVRSDRPLGVGAAIRLGYAHALEHGARVAVVVAADAQMDLGEVGRVAAPLLAGRADYVQGCRFDGARVRGLMPWTRFAGNRVLSACTSWAAGRPVGDSQCGFTAASRVAMRVLTEVRMPPGYGFPAFARLAAHEAGLRVAEVPVTAIYGSEVSGIRAWRDPLGIAVRLLALGAARRWRAGARDGRRGDVRADEVA